MTKEGSIKILNVKTTGAGVLMLGRCHTSHYIKYALSSTLWKYSTLIANVWWDFNATSNAFVDFYLLCIYDGSEKPFWQEFQPEVTKIILKWGIMKNHALFKGEIIGKYRKYIEDI